MTCSFPANVSLSLGTVPDARVFESETKSRCVRPRGGRARGFVGEKNLVSEVCDLPDSVSFALERVLGLFLVSSTGSRVISSWGQWKI